MGLSVHTCSFIALIFPRLCFVDNLGVLQPSWLLPILCQYSSSLLWPFQRHHSCVFVFVNALPNSRTAFVDSSLVHFSFPRLMHLQALSLCHSSGFLVAPQMVCLQLFGRFNFHHCLSCGLCFWRPCLQYVHVLLCPLRSPSLSLWSLRPSCLLKTGSPHLSVSASSLSFSHSLFTDSISDHSTLKLELLDCIHCHTEGKEGSLDLSPPP